MLLGSSLAQVLAFRKSIDKKFKTTSLKKIVNIFHDADPLATRLSPFTDSTSTDLNECLSNPEILKSAIDVIHKPNNFPNNFNNMLLPFYVHDTLWEDNTVIKFIINCVLRLEKTESTPVITRKSLIQAKRVRPFSMKSYGSRSSIDSGKKYNTELSWRRFRNKILSKYPPRHRCYDFVVTSFSDTIILKSKLMYGLLGEFNLGQETYNLYIYVENCWILVHTAETDHHGMAILTFQKNTKEESIKTIVQNLVPGNVVPFKIEVDVDKSFAIGYIFVLPVTPSSIVKQRAVIFSVNGSFCSSTSLRCTDPKVRAGSVDLVRYWKDRLGVLVIFVTSRPDIQKNNVEQWLKRHGFPHVPLYFSTDRIVSQPINSKKKLLKNLSNELEIVACYGSLKDEQCYLDVFQSCQVYAHTNKELLQPSMSPTVFKPRASLKKKSLRLNHISGSWNEHLMSLDMPESVSPRARGLNSSYGFAWGCS